MEVNKHYVSRKHTSSCASARFELVHGELTECVVMQIPHIGYKMNNQHTDQHEKLQQAVPVSFNSPRSETL
jgi:hypothetical protein